MGDIKSEMFKRGYSLYKKNRFDEARREFDKLLCYEEYFYKAMRMIIKTNIRQYRFWEARELISKYFYLDDFNTLVLIASIDEVEYNYENSILELKTAISKMRNAQRSYSTLADIYINKGEFDNARKTLNLLSEEEVFLPDKIRNVMISVVLGNYEEALQNLSKINLNSIKGSIAQQILFLKAYYTVMYFLGKEPRQLFSDEPAGIQRFKLALYGTKEASLERVKNELDQQARENHLYFSPSLDISEFLGIVKDKISSTNPRFSNMTQLYGIKFDFPVGKINEDDVYGAIVRTPIGSDKIISIVAADFSDEFDKEGLSTDPLLRKRLMIK